MTQTFRNLFGSRGKDTHRPRYETPFRRVHALRVVFLRGFAARRARRGYTQGRGRGSQREKESVREREGGEERRMCEYVTTMYFGAALHTPRGGQCPSLLRLKEGAEGREGWREQGRDRGRGRFAVEREAGRQGGGHRRGVEKNEQTSSEKWRERVAEERPGAHSLSLSLSSFPFFFSLVLSCLSHLFFSLPLLSCFSLSRALPSQPPLSPSLCLVVTLSRLSLSFALRCTAGCSGELLTPRTIPS